MKKFNHIVPTITNLAKFQGAALQRLIELDQPYEDSYDRVLAEIEAELILHVYKPDEAENYVVDKGWAYYSREVAESVIETMRGKQFLYDIDIVWGDNEICATTPSGYFVADHNSYMATHRELTGKERAFLAEARERDRAIYNLQNKGQTMETITKNFFLKDTMVPKQVKEGKNINVDKEVYDELDTMQKVAVGDTQKENKFRIWLEYEIDRVFNEDGLGQRDRIDIESFMPDNFVFYKEAYARAAIHVMYGWDNTYDFDDPNEAACKKDGIYFVMAEHYYNPTRHKLTPTVSEIIQNLLELDNYSKGK